MASLDDDFEVLSNRVAGHSFVDGAKAGVARERSTGYILKVADGDERGRRELEFYQKIYNSCDPKVVKLRSFCPTFHGVRVIRGRTFMRLGDVSFDGCNVMDIKIGAITWDHEASSEKIQLERSKYPWQEKLGFKILGYRCTRFDGQVETLTKEKAKKLHPEEVQSAIWTFLSPDGNEIILERRRSFFLRQLEQIKEMIEEETCFQFISSSILLSYKKVPFVHEHTDEEAKATMIDFAHTFQTPSYQVDVNYLKGLSSLITFFKPKEE